MQQPIRPKDIPSLSQGMNTTVFVLKLVQTYFDQFKTYTKSTTLIVKYHFSITETAYMDKFCLLS